MSGSVEELPCEDIQDPVFVDHLHRDNKHELVRCRPEHFLNRESELSRFKDFALPAIYHYHLLPSGTKTNPKTTTVTTVTRPEMTPYSLTACELEHSIAPRLTSAAPSPTQTKTSAANQPKTRLTSEPIKQR